MKDLEQFTSQLENLISSKTVIGDPIVVDEVTLLPIIKANFGFGMGGGTTGGVTSKGGSGGGGGAVITPVAIVVISGGNVDLLVIDQQAGMGLGSLVEKLPGLIASLPFGKKKQGASPKEEAPASEEQAPN